MRIGRWLTAVTLGIVLAASAARSDEPADALAHNMDVSIGNPLMLTPGVAVRYEIRFPADRSWTADAGYWSLGGENHDISAFGLGLGYRYWTAGHALKGFYVGPIASVNFYTLHVTEPVSQLTLTTAATLVGFGGVFGYQYVWPKGFLIDWSLGVENKFGAAEGTVGTTTVKATYVTGIGLAGRLALGYAWH